MSYSAFPVARMPNIQISCDNSTTGSLSNVTCTFNNFIANEANNANWTGEKYTGLTVTSNTITVPKMTLVVFNFVNYTYTSTTGDHITFYGIYDASNNALLSNMAEKKQWGSSSLSSLRSQYYTTWYGCQTAYAIVPANTALQFKTTSSTSTGVDFSTHVLLFQLEP